MSCRSLDGWIRGEHKYCHDHRTGPCANIVIFGSAFHRCSTDGDALDRGALDGCTDDEDDCDANDSDPNDVGTDDDGTDDGRTDDGRTNNNSVCRWDLLVLVKVLSNHWISFGRRMERLVEMGERGLRG